MPAPLPTEPGALELHVRTLVAAKLQGVQDAGRVHARPRYSDSEGQWIDLTGVQHAVTQANETHAVFVNLVGFTEAEDTCDRTNLTLNYEIEVVRSLVDERSDMTNSHDDFAAFVMRARAAFKADRTFGYKDDEVHHNLLQTAERARVEEEDGETAHRIGLSLEVAVKG